LSVARAYLASFFLMGALGGCATVAMVDPSTPAEVALTESRSVLYAAADAFCEAARKKGLAAGEASLSGLAGALFGSADDSAAYWRLIGADRQPAAVVLRQVRADASEIVTGLSRVEGLAKGVAEAGSVSRDDVASFEKVMIHARQARESLAEALSQLGQRGLADNAASTELAGLDRALATARATADDLAARRSETLAALPAS
jgi:hypothetical protein